MHRKSKSIKKENIKLASDFISSRKTLSSNSFINPINVGRYYYQTITEYESKKNSNMSLRRRYILTCVKPSRTQKKSQKSGDTSTLTITRSGT